MRSNDPLAYQITARVGILALELFACSVPAHAQPVQRAVSPVDVQRLANGVLGVMSYTVAPDITTSALAISNAAIGSPGLTMQQLGGSFTWSKTLPLYLEGNAAYSRFDPVLAATDGTGQGFVPVEWEAVSTTGGIGWDFRVSKHWVVRPIFNFMLGTVASDLRIAKWWFNNNSNLDLTFLDGGRMNVYGVGGALMLEYEKSASEAEDDLQLRYTNVQLKSYDTPNLSVAGHAKPKMCRSGQGGVFRPAGPRCSGRCVGSSRVPTRTFSATRGNSVSSTWRRSAWASNSTRAPWTSG
jgi:hypothetical protein